MAIEIKSLPTLEGKKASLFIEKIEKESANKISKEKVEKMKKAAQKILEQTNV